MATNKQTAANRANAQKSTGPRSVQGKAVSSQNALQSGIDAQSHIIRGEDPAALDALTAQYLSDHHPQSAAERALVDILVDSEWVLRRLRKAEAQLWEQELASIEDSTDHWYSDDPVPENQMLGRAVLSLEQTLPRLERRRDLLQRAYRRALQDLREIQSSRPQSPAAAPCLPAGPPAAPAPETPPEPAPPTPSSPSPDPENGFVPQNPPAASVRPMRTLSPAGASQNPLRKLRGLLLRRACSTPLASATHCRAAALPPPPPEGAPTLPSALARFAGRLRTPGAPDVQ